jgi:hypothetical protein
VRIAAESSSAAISWQVKIRQTRRHRRSPVLSVAVRAPTGSGTCTANRRNEVLPVKRDYLAREVAGAEKSTWWERAVETWPDYANYQKKTARQIPVFVLEPMAESL